MPPGINRGDQAGSKGLRGGQCTEKYESWPDFSQLGYHAFSHETIEGHANIKRLSLIPNRGKANKP